MRDSTTGARLLAERNKAGLTREELAKKSGIDQSTICRIENGKQAPTVPTMVALANALGVRWVINDEAAA